MEEEKEATEEVEEKTPEPKVEELVEENEETEEKEATEEVEEKTPESKGEELIEEKEETVEREEKEEVEEKTPESKVEELVEENEETEERQEKKETTRRVGKDDNIVFVGKKGIMSYVLAVVTQFNNGMSEVILKARGRAISRAVDVAEVVRQRFMTDIKIKDIQISTEEIQGDEGPIKVSAIEITLTK